MSEKALSTRISNVVLGFEATEHQEAIRALAVEARELESENKRLREALTLISNITPIMADPDCLENRINSIINDAMNASTSDKSQNEDYSAFVLKPCPNCIQMTNHIGHMCQKCKKPNDSGLLRQSQEGASK